MNSKLNVSALVAVSAVMFLSACSNYQEEFDNNFGALEYADDVVESSPSGGDDLSSPSGSHSSSSSSNPYVIGNVLTDSRDAKKYELVTIGEQTYRLEEPFLVLATQNPIEQEGTYPLPEAQVDRFMLKVVITYPKRVEEKEILHQVVNGQLMGSNNQQPILKPADIMKARELVREVYMDEKIENYITDIVFATRFPK